VVDNGPPSTPRRCLEQPKPQSVVASVRVPTAHLAKVDEAAAAAETTRSRLLREFLRAMVEDQ
jgi:hypothetical protein